MQLVLHLGDLLHAPNEFPGIWVKRSQVIKAVPNDGPQHAGPAWNLVGAPR
jgi:hypothetical protein